MNRFFSLCLCVSAVIFSGCTSKTENRVVLYCSVDEAYAKPLIKKLEAQTGLQIDALFDTEATKTAGLANRIRAEQNRPRADVFWSSALLQTLLMSDEKLLQAHNSASARDLPARFVGRDWVGVGVRAHLWASAYPDTAREDTVGLSGLARVPAGHPEVGFSNPQFGTASDWVTALSLRRGEAAVLADFRRFKAGGARVLPGNGDVARAVGESDLQQGVTDSDDLLAQKRERKPIFPVVFRPDSVLIPGAASILKGAPHPKNAQKLLDAIASAQNERALTQQMPGVFSLRRLGEKSNFQSGGVDFSFLMSAPRDDYSKWAATWRRIREPLSEIFAPK